MAMRDAGPSRGGPGLLIAGASVRALAASVLSSRAATRFPDGFVALDYFGDADLVALAARHPIRVLSLPRDLGLPRNVAALGRAALELDWQALVYAGGLENRPGLLRLLERRGRVLGNRAVEVQAARDPELLFRFLAAEGIPHAAIVTGLGPAADVADDATEPAAPPAARCLVKPVRSGGGARVRFRRPGERRPPGHYLQEFLEGPAGSAALLGNGCAATLLGVTEQMAGWEALGGSGFRYGGNIAGPPQALLSGEALAALAAAASRIAARFSLRGLFGIDFILADGVPRLIELNPRYTASMELLEEIAGRNLFDLHLEALEGGPLPPGPLRLEDRDAPRFVAKGILYAREAARAPAPGSLLALGCRDVPVRGERIEPGQPICTLVARGDSPASCRRALLARAAEVRALLDPPETAGWTAFPLGSRSW